MKLDFCELIKKSIELLIKHDFKGKSAFSALYIPKTKNEAWIYAEKSGIREGCFRLRISAKRKGSNYLISQYHTGDKTEDELKEYLKTEYLETTENIANLQTTIMELSDDVDSKEGEFPFDY